MQTWSKPPKDMKTAQDLASRIAIAMIDNGAYENMTAEEVAKYAIDVAEYIFNVDINGSGD